MHPDRQDVKGPGTGHAARWLLGSFVAALVGLLLMEWAVDRHGHFLWEESFGLHAGFGFLACVVLILVARFILRPLVQRREDYYDR